MGIQVATTVTLVRRAYQGFSRIPRHQFAVSITLSTGMAIYPIGFHEYMSEGFCREMIKDLQQTREFADAQYVEAFFD